MKRIIPDIGVVVRRANGTLDFVAQIRIDHGPNPADAEMGVLWWGEAKERFKVGDKWEPHVFPASRRESADVPEGR